MPVPSTASEPSSSAPPPGVRLHNALEEAPTDHDRILAALSGRERVLRRRDDATDALWTARAGRRGPRPFDTPDRWLFGWWSMPIPPPTPPATGGSPTRRAESIVRFLAQSGVPPERLTGEGRGIAEGEVERVEFEITEG